MGAPRVQFVHGLESSPQGTKARVLARHFVAVTPAMEVRDFEGCVALQAESIRRFRPDVVVGSSFGGAVTLALLQRGLWRGPTLLLAPAASHQGLPLELPAGVRVWLVHGRRDGIVAVEESRALAQHGTPELVKLLEIEDDHALHGWVEAGGLTETVRELWEVAEQDAAPGGIWRHVAVFFDEPTLWPVLLVVLAHVALAGALLLIAAARGRSLPAFAALGLLAWASAQAVRREWRVRRFGRVTRCLLGLWLLASIGAVAAARYGLL